MAEKRKDNKGRVLKENEAQRKDGSYQYRWRDRVVRGIMYMLKHLIYYVIKRKKYYVIKVMVSK